MNNIRIKITIIILFSYLITYGQDSSFSAFGCKCYDSIKITYEKDSLLDFHASANNFDSININFFEYFDDTISIYIDTFLIYLGYFKTNQILGSARKNFTVELRKMSSNENIIYLTTKINHSKHCMRTRLINLGYKFLFINLENNLWYLTFSNRIISLE